MEHNDFTFTDDPPDITSGRAGASKYAADIVAACKANPGKWVLYDSMGTGLSTVGVGHNLKKRHGLLTTMRNVHKKEPGKGELYVSWPVDGDDDG